VVAASTTLTFALDTADATPSGVVGPDGKVVIFGTVASTGSVAEASMLVPVEIEQNSTLRVGTGSSLRTRQIVSLGLVEVDSAGTLTLDNSVFTVSHADATVCLLGGTIETTGDRDMQVTAGRILGNGQLSVFQLLLAGTIDPGASCVAGAPAGTLTIGGALKEWNLFDLVGLGCVSAWLCWLRALWHLLGVYAVVAWPWGIRGELRIEAR
jgi:hypothetical protein